MIPAPYPPDETMRLAAVRALQLLDSAAEPRFDRITRLASKIFGTPMAFISLLDEHRQWFKSRIGLDVSETPRSISFCGYAILQDDPLVVLDATRDARFAGNPLVVGEPFIRFYAGRALRTRGGSKVGTICVLDTKVREFSTSDLDALQDLAALTETQLLDLGLDDALRLLMEADRQRAEQKRMFDAFMAHTPCVVFIKDQHRRYAYVNRKVEEVFGQTAQALLGRTDAELFPEEVASQIDLNDQQVLSSAEPTQILESVPTPDGRMHYWIVSKFPLKAPSGELMLAGVAFDVTAEKEAEMALRKSEERYRDLFENTGDMIGGVDAEGRYLYVNPAWHVVHGYTPEELPDLRMLEIVSPEDRPRATAMLRRVMSGEDLVGLAVRVMTKDGRELKLEGSVIHSSEDGRPVARGLFRDVTARELAQERLKESERRLALVVQGAGVGTWDWHVPSGHLATNDRWATMLGYEPSEVESHLHGWEHLVHPEDLSRVWRALRDHFDGKTEMYEMEYRMRTKSGAYCWLLDRGCVTERDEHGKPIRVSGTHLDITSRKNAQWELQRLLSLQRAILDSANCSIISTSPVGLIISFNSTAERWLGYSAQEIIGTCTPVLFHDRAEMETRARELQEELHQPVGSGFEVFVEHAKLGQIDEREWTYIRRDGSKFPVRLSVTALTDNNGTVFGFLGVARDITTEKAAVDAMRQAKEAAELANQTKSRFLANMSHEVRTPLNGIIGVNSMLLETPLSPEQRSLVEVVRDSGKLLLAIVNDILDFSKVESGLLELEETHFDLHELIDGLEKLHSNRASGKGLRLQKQVAPGLPHLVAGDPVRIRQVLSNLISNAIKFSSTGEVLVNVEPDTAEHGDDSYWVRFSVQDNGIGISPEAQRKIFDPFQQADSSTTRKYGGTGLGLSICRELVTIMGGELKLESEVNRGSTFWFTTPFRIPASSATPPEEREAPLGAPEFTGLRVLVAEDSSVNQLVIHHELNRIGCTVTVVADGRAAVEKFAEQEFDLILMDCQMPEMDGYAASSSIRKTERGKHVPIIAVTANAMVGQRDECLLAGMNDYVSKPFTRERLSEAIARGLDHSRMQSEIDQSPPLDLKELEGLRQEGIAAGIDLLAQMVEAFASESAEIVTELHESTASDDFARVQRVAHKLKGIAGTIGARRLQAQCRELEEAAGQNQRERVQIEVTWIEGEIVRVQEALRSAAASE